MTKEEVVEGILNMAPVRLADGQFGVFLISANGEGACGIQVPGEEEPRWIPVDWLRSESGVIVEIATAIDLTHHSVAEIEAVLDRVLTLDGEEA